jgi:hypothetical protein
MCQLQLIYHDAVVCSFAVRQMAVWSRLFKGQVYPSIPRGRKQGGCSCIWFKPWAGLSEGE